MGTKASRGGLRFRLLVCAWVSFMAGCRGTPTSGADAGPVPSPAREAVPSAVHDSTGDEARPASQEGGADAAAATGPIGSDSGTAATGALAIDGGTGATGPLTIAMSGDYWPLHAGSGEDRIGLEADLGRALGAALGREVRFLGRGDLGVGALEAVASGRAEVALSAITPTDERRKQVDFTQPYLQIPYRLLRQSASPALADLAGLEAKKVAVAAGPAMGDLSSALAAASVVEVPSVRAGVALLRKGGVDFVAGEVPALADLLDGTLELTGPVLGQAALAMAVPRGSAGKYDPLLASLQPALARLETLYRPGEVADHLFLAACDQPEAGHRYLRSTGEGAFAAMPLPGTLDWYEVRWGQAGAVPLATVPPDPDPEEDAAPRLCVSAPVRLLPGDAAPAAGMVKAQQRLRRDRERNEIPGAEGRISETDVVHDNKALELFEDPPGWIRLAGGTVITAPNYTLNQECSTHSLLETGSDSEDQYEELKRWPCQERGFFIFVSRRGKTDFGLLTVTTEAPAE